ncbi:MAG: hypothetical protein FJ090_23195 [Deltaproteobacteria bacterium]|nr:hypothetical protein [Deltaproteobacteria bacterium]
MSPRVPCLVVSGLGDDGEGEIVPLADVLADNCGDGDLCAALAALPAGGVLVVGGGAAPEVRSIRVDLAPGALAAPVSAWFAAADALGLADGLRAWRESTDGGAIVAECMAAILAWSAGGAR